MAKHQFKTTNIKGKAYVEVNERIKFFRTDKKYQFYGLESEIVKLDDSECVIIARIIDPENRIVATGIAQEYKSASRINSTSYVENCETSAWGRALGNLGIGIDTSIATADEVNNAIHQQQNPAKPKADVFKQALQHLEGSKTKDTALERILGKYGDQFTPDQIKQLKALV
jgi:hypothetical protein